MRLYQWAILAAHFRLDDRVFNIHTTSFSFEDGSSGKAKCCGKNHAYGSCVSTSNWAKTSIEVVVDASSLSFEAPQFAKAGLLVQQIVVHALSARLVVGAGKARRRWILGIATAVVVRAQVPFVLRLFCREALKKVMHGFAARVGQAQQQYHFMVVACCYREYPPMQQQWPSLLARLRRCAEGADRTNNSSSSKMAEDIETIITAIALRRRRLPPSTNDRRWLAAAAVTAACCGHCQLVVLRSTTAVAIVVPRGGRSKDSAVAIASIK